MLRENNKIIRKVSKICGKTIYDYSLINEGDNVLIGISGGKDSLTLLDILSEKKRKMPISFELKACYIELNDLGKDINVSELKEFCLKRNIDLIHKTVSTNFEQDPSKDKCFVCSWHRRKTLFKVCRELNFNKLALGHNMDDIVQTILMNMCFQGNISTMPIKLKLFDGELELIRPLGEIEESIIEKYSSIKELSIQRHDCPYGKEQSRPIFNDIISDLEKINPNIRKNIFNSLKNIKDEYLL